MIQVFRLTHRYPSGIEALRDVSFQVAEGEFALVLGRSGSGKSTLLSLLTVEQRPTAGQILVGGRNVGTLKSGEIPGFRRGIGRLWEDVRLLAARKVWRNVALPLEIAGWGGKATRERVMQVLEQVGMLQHAESLPAWLTRAEQQRVALARAIVHEPALVIADEPTGQLDFESAREFIQLIGDVARMGSTVVVATRDGRLRAERPERVIELNQGFLIEGGA